MTAAALRFLSFELSEGTDGVCTIDAEAATSAAQWAQAQAEVQLVLDWAWRAFPHTHGPLEEGHDWDHEVQTAVALATSDNADGAWHTVALTLSASPVFVAAFKARFGDAVN